MKNQVIRLIKPTPYGRWTAHWEHGQHNGLPFQKTYRTRAEARAAIKVPSPCR